MRLCESRPPFSDSCARQNRRSPAATRAGADPATVDRRRGPSSAGDDEIDRFRPLALLVGLDVEADALAFVERFHSSALDRRDVNEDVAPAIVRLDETIAANPGMKAVTLDIASGEAIRSFAQKLTADFPALNVVIHNAGIMRPESAPAGAVADAEAMVADRKSVV